MNRRLLAYTISNASTPARLARLRATICDGRASAGLRDFDWVLWANSPTAHDLGVTIGVPRIMGCGNSVNVGQHVAQRSLLEVARTEGYDFLLRIDDDCEWLTKRWLHRLLDVYERASNGGRYPFMLAPKVSGLQRPIETRGDASPAGVKLHLVEILGGVCRLMPVASLAAWAPDVREAMGAGDAHGLANVCAEHRIPMFVTPWVRVRHQTSAQEAEDAEWSVMHDIAQRIPYVPDYVAEAA